MEILALIPARGGSKRVPRKNIKQVAGKPLIAWTINCALRCVRIGRVVVSTDDSEISSIAESLGAEVPFKRPGEFAGSDASDLPVYRHALSWLEENESYRPDVVVWLRPTAPLREGQDIDGAIDLLVQTKADWVRSVCLAEHHPYWMKRLEGDRLVPFCEDIEEGKFYRRQLLPPVYRLNGAVDVTWRKTVLERETLWSGDVKGYVMPLERSVDVDDEIDLALAELLLRRREGA